MVTALELDGGHGEGGGQILLYLVAVVTLELPCLLLLYR